MKLKNFLTIGVQAAGTVLSASLARAIERALEPEYAGALAVTLTFILAACASLVLFLGVFAVIFRSNNSFFKQNKAGFFVFLTFCISLILLFPCTAVLCTANPTCSGSLVFLALAGAVFMFSSFFSLLSSLIGK